MTTKDSISAAPHEQFSNRYRYYVLALLTLGYVFNFVDRQVMTILIEPIKAEFGATDTQIQSQMIMNKFLQIEIY